LKDTITIERIVTMNASLWARLTNAKTNEIVWVNLALVRTMEPTQSNTRLSFDKDSSLVVTESPRSILADAGIPRQAPSGPPRPTR
jgi:hypothetical protein